MGSSPRRSPSPSPTSAACRSPLIAVSVSGQFQQTNNCGTQLAAGAVCTISVVFAPTQLGALSGTLTIYDALRTQTVSLSGTGVAPPVFSVTPLSLTFTNHAAGRGQRAANPHH